MIFGSPSHRAEFFFVFREARRSTPMMAADRSTLSCRAILFLFVSFGIPTVVRSSTLEDSARELARKIAAVLLARENVSCEIRNISSLQMDEAARVEQTLKEELQDRGVRLSSSSGSTTSVVVTLSENYKNLIWTAEIHEDDTSHLVLVAPTRTLETRGAASAMPVTIRSEKFWEGPERVLDAGEITNGAGKSRLVLLLPNGVSIQDRQSGLAGTIEITSNQSASRDPWGNLNIELGVDMIGLFLAPQVCAVNLESREVMGCPPTQVPNGGTIAAHPAMFDIAPPGPPPPGKGTEVEMAAVCGGSSQFLATGSGDYTQPDSLQVFQADSSRAVAVSAELDFPGPITALHAGQSVQGAPRAVVRNLTTGNYEAYRLFFSCGQ
jgi:hypothetical protein